MIDAHIAHGDVVLMEPVHSPNSIRNGDIVSATVPGLGSTLKYFFNKGKYISLEAANPNYEPLKVNLGDILIQGKLLAVWRTA